MNKTIKKIVALGMGATMLASTAAMALATDLSSYPAPFIKDGVFVGKIVIGEKAGSIDTIGALDIAASLQRAASTKVSSSGTSTTLDGGFRLDTTGDRIYLGEKFSVDSVTKDNLNLLTSTDGFEDSEGTSYSFTQSVTLGKGSLGGILGYSQHTLSNTDAFLAVDVSEGSAPTQANNFYMIKIDFNKAINATSSKVIGQKITLLGNEYTFSSESSGNKVVLYGSSEEVSLTPKDEVTKTVDGKDFKVKVIGFASTGTKVTISVNGATDSLSEGTSKTIGGLKIYAKSVSSWNNGIDGFATLQLGAQKLSFEDGQEVTAGTSDTSVSGAKVAIGASSTNKAEGMSSLYVFVNPNSDFKSLPEGGQFVDPVFGTFAVKYVDTSYGLTDTTRDMITVRPSGNNRVYAKLTALAGSEQTFYFDLSGTLGWDVGRGLSVVEGTPAALDQYIYASPATSTSTTTDAPRYTHLLRVKSIKNHATQGSATFEDALTGQEYKTTEGQFNDTVTNRTMTIDGYTYNVNLVTATAGSEQLTVTYGTAVTIYPAITLKGLETFAVVSNVTGINNSVLIPSGTWVDTPTGTFFYNSSTASYTVGKVTYVTTNNTGGLYMSSIGVLGSTVSVVGGPALLIKEDKDNANPQVENVVFIQTSNDSNGVNVGAPVLTGTTQTGSMADTYTTGYVDYFGTYITKYVPTGYNNNVVTVTYPTSQMFANIFMAPLAAKATSTSTSGAVALNPISVGLAILDSEASLGDKPYIVVGGPCANTVAAALLGNKADCAAGFTEGKATIKLFADKNALLVAGFSGKDTQGACRVLANYKDYSFTGTELEVVTTNLNSLSVKSVSS